MANEETLADRAKDLRTLSGLSQKDLGAHCGLTGGAIGMIETGERKTPSAETLHKLAAGTGTTVEYLLTGAGPRPTKESVLTALSPKEEAPAEPTPTFLDSAAPTGTDGVR